MAKITFIGGGSAKFVSGLVRDLFTFKRKHLVSERRRTAEMRVAMRTCSIAAAFLIAARAWSVPVR